MAKGVVSHRPPFGQKNSISGYNPFVSAYHSFAQLGNEHIPEPVMFEPFPIFSMDYLDCSAAGYKDGIQVAVSFVVCDSKKFWRIRKKSYICSRLESVRAKQEGANVLRLTEKPVYTN